MTPFNAVAVLAMLIAFYPEASPNALAAAIRERPEYFSGAEQIAATGYIVLPDARVLRVLMFPDATHPFAYWQISGPGIDTASIGDRIVLEPGPLQPLDVDRAIPPALAPGFAELAGQYLAQVDGGAAFMRARVGELAAAADPADMHALFDGELGDGEYALHNQLSTLDELDPSEGEQAAHTRDPVIATAQTDYADPEAQAPADILVDPDPGPRPRPDPGDDERWVRNWPSTE